MKSPARAAALAGLALLSACVAPVGPVEVTRFHLPEAQSQAHGTIAVEPAAGVDGNTLEFRTYAVAVTRELNRIGYASAAPGSPGDQVALLAVERRAILPQRARGPVSVGVGGGSGVGVGVGVGIDLSGPPPEQVETEMRVSIRDRASGRTLWEGRASFTVRASSPLAQTSLGAAKLTEALFKDFPGESGQTIYVP
ncbi:DUF4136 domain-containing protein [Novosphingobium album (ex Liu et al. 2023)]|uniref:DUF4136 domain-containing protein n=1 Tax=Novosphingobium album (ex Liu et al. 2023) TaxID=3031130 RepID=A0ABT5WMZ1_9SPHN|nr:DUF4136 domain-containing protein [Novosphingobium album (ex Liu et al. 2023)]MDE8651405.1 DUF4136 domain-containing protein [Novosphingobium album (ex Liu et al. 2023)]